MKKDWHPNQVPQEVKYAGLVVAENVIKGNSQWNLIKKKGEEKKVVFESTPSKLINFKS